MGNPIYCSLHQHTDASFLDSCNKPDVLAKRAKSVGMPAIAITDHGNVHNYIKMYKECKKQGVKFIPGLEFYFTHKHADRERKSRHITILCMNDKGLETIYKLSTVSNQPVDMGGGFFYRPRIDWEMLEKYNEGLICLTGCMNSPVNHEFGRNKNYDAGKTHAEHLLHIFGRDRLFVELQLVNDPLTKKGDRTIYIPEQDVIFEWSKRLAADLNLKTVATNDSHYIDKSDAFAHEILKAIDAGATLETPRADPDNPTGERGRLVFSGFDYHVKSTEEMLEKFSEAEVAMSNTIADMCNVNIPLKQNHTPKFDPKLDAKQAMEFLRAKARDGWKKLEIQRKPNVKAYEDRVKMELKDVEEASLQDYFLIVWDVVDYCIRNGIPVGRGRGSAAGSLVSYLLRITDVDPVENGLIWERFWNRGRKGSMPDVDLDICIERRGEVVTYLRNKFGEDKVFPICAISTMTTKAAIKDVGKVVGLPFAYVNELTDMVPHKCKNIQQAIEEIPELKEMATNGIDKEVIEWEKELTKATNSPNPNQELIDLLNKQITDRKKKLKTTFDVAQKLEDVARQRSAHACALLISDEPVFGKVPLCFDAKKKKMLTAFDMYDLEELGYLKLDILGLKTLDVCSKVYPEGVRSIRDFDDPKVFELISKGYTKGVFQFESPLGRQWCKKLKPQNILELSDLNALLRPAVLEVGMADEYIKNRADPVEMEAAFSHPDLKPILGNTYGCVVYQEQMLEIAKKFAGFSLSEADLLRKAVGKKIPEELAKLKVGFIAGVKKNYDEKLGEQLWSWIEKGAEYGFNKSHSLSYAQLAYITAWMKLNHTAKFFWALLIHSKDEQKPQEEIRSIFFDAKRFKVNVRPPSSQRGNTDFELDGTDIYFGLQHIKGIGEASCRMLQSIKKTTWEEIIRNKCQFKIKKTILEGLILSGSFDHFQLTRKSMLMQYRFMSELTDKEVPVFEHIMYGDPANLSKTVKAGTQTITIPRATDFVDAIDKFVSFLDKENVNLKLIISSRAEKLKEFCANFLIEYNSGKEFSIREVADYESTLLGIPATCSCVDGYYNHNTTHFLIEIEKEHDGVGICTVAMIANSREVTDKRGRKMAFITLEDKSFSMDAVVFANPYMKYGKLIEKGKVVLLNGKTKGGSFLIDSIEAL